MKRMMTLRIRPQSLTMLGAMVALGFAAGCTPNPSAEFAWRDSTQDLLPDARKTLQNTIKENFGTPDDLVAWERLPVNYGGVKGTVAAAPEGTQLAAGEFAVTLEGEGSTVQKTDSLLWMSGENAGETSQVLAVNESPLRVALAESTAAPEGTAFSVNFGHQLQLGRMVYMKNCMHCHGVAGDGAGPTAQYLNPRPRDYRLGVFKFTETLATERVTRDDLWRVVKYGIPGTYMPSFLLLDDQETTAVIEYLRWLAMRGEMEKRLGDELTDYSTAAIQDEYQKGVDQYDAALAEYNAAVKKGEKATKPEAAESFGDLKSAATKSFKGYKPKDGEEVEGYVTTDYPDVVDSTADFIAENWTRADDPASVIHPSVPRVADTPESRANGRLLYLSDKTKCYTCHGNTGRGNGGAVEDFWPNPNSKTGGKFEVRGLHDVWGNPLQPRNLRLGQYRGGRRPIDIYRRLYAGIKGTPMPAFGGTVLKDEEIWDVVNYVMSLPYETESATPPAPAAHMAAKPVQ